MAASATDAYVDPLDLAGFLKPVFGELQWLLPEGVVLQKLVKFSAGDKVGAYFQEPVQVKTSWGVTFCGSDGGVVTLNASIPSQTASAQVTPFLTVLNDQVSYSMFDRGQEAGKTAFMATGAYIGKNLSMQLRRLLEMSMMSGQDGFGTVLTYSSASTGSVVLTAASARIGVLSMLEGAAVNIVRGTNVIADGSSASASTGIKISAVDIATLTLTFAALPYVGTSAATPAADDILFLHGAAGPTTGNAATAVSFQEMIGVRKQISATTGTIFNINKATYQAYRGNVVTSFGPISAGSILAAAAKAINRGFQGTLALLMSPSAWSVLNSRNIGQQVFDSSYKTSNADIGTDAIVLRGQGVKVECYPTGFQADGELLLLPKENMKRIGSAYENSGGENGDTDISFMIPGSPLRFIDPVQGVTAVKVECRSDQAIYLQKPAFAVLCTGVTY